MSIVTSKEIAKAIKVDTYGFIGTFFGWILMKVLKISTINRIYNKNKHKSDLDFLNGLLTDFQIRFEIPEEDLKRLPKDSAYITVSNHPLGGIDGILLLKLMLEQRSDFKIIANFLLHRIKPLVPYIMPVNPFEDHKDAKSSIVGFKNSLLHLQNGHPLGIFPAGEVSTYKDGKLVDPMDYLDKSGIDTDSEIKNELVTDAEKSEFLEKLKSIANSDKTFKNLKENGKRIPYDPDVEIIQTSLQFLGFLLPKWGVDGKFGPETEASSNGFKSKYLPILKKFKHLI